MSQVANIYNPNLAPGAPGIPGYPGQLQTPVVPAFTPYQFNAPAYQTHSVPTDLLHVKGVEGAKMYQVDRDSRVALFDEDEDYLYIKKTDSNGVASYMKFKLIEEPFEAPSTNQNGVKFVTVEEFERFKEEVLNAQQTISAAGAVTDDATTVAAESSGKSNGSGKRRTGTN